jgi:hypothetical protein
MSRKVERKAAFRKGDKVHLDQIQDILGLIPIDCYQQDDPIEWDILNEMTVVNQ